MDCWFSTQKTWRREEEGGRKNCIILEFHCSSPLKYQKADKKEEWHMALFFSSPLIYFAWLSSFAMINRSFFPPPLLFAYNFSRKCTNSLLWGMALYPELCSPALALQV